jgi:hypothetical protein
VVSFRACAKASAAVFVPSARTWSTARLWNRMKAQCRPAMITCSSLRGSATIAVPPARRGRSSNSPPDPISSFAGSLAVSYSIGLPVGPAPYTESRSSAGVRPVGDVNGSVGVPSGELVSKVTSWSMNCPRNVVPAVCVGLSGLFALRTGSVISLTGPALRSSRASSSPPCAPSASSDFVIPWFAVANGGSSPNRRPKCCASVETNRLRAALTSTGRAKASAARPPSASAPAPRPSLARNSRRS